ncbi:MAG: choice-of-anchor L domain-containing protein [Flavobacteriales bacterium]|nr:choice-of-anchor L domain-containing protein [Flavobacteriales bacterium]
MKHLSTLVLSLTTFGATGQLTVTDSLSASSLAQLLEGLNVSISNVTVNCAPSAMGHFIGTSEMEIEEGLVLTSGGADMVAGPVGTFASGYPGTPGDADLEISLGGGGGMTYDGCVLEFDCVPTGDTLLFNFSFGSEEYQEFVGSVFNDIFAIYLTGPGFPIGTNVGALPDGTPVAINNVNNGLNPTYYHDNEAGAGQYVAYDGFTTNLTAFAVVSPDDVYHFKVAIADVADGAFDSGVFLEAFSFRSNGLTTAIAEAQPAMRAVVNGDQLMVQAPTMANAYLMLINSAGSVVHRARLTGDRMTIDISGLSKGIYTVQLPGNVPVRFVKQ